MKTCGALRPEKHQKILPINTSPNNTTVVLSSLFAMFFYNGFPLSQVYLMYILIMQPEALSCQSLELLAISVDQASPIRSDLNLRSARVNEAY